MCYLIIGLLCSCFALAFALVYYALWQDARKANTNMILNFINRRKHMIDNACDWLCGNCPLADCDHPQEPSDCPLIKSLTKAMKK